MIPLHVHSNYTLLKGTIPVEQLIAKAIESSLPALAITDTNSMQGVIQFTKIANENNVKPLIGCLIDEPANNEEYIILLAKNNNGYRDICKLITARKLNEEFTLSYLREEKLDNLIVISPSIKIFPEVGSSKPEIIRNVVVFPQPEGPNRVTSSPSLTSRLTSSTALTPSFPLPKTFSRCCNTR